MPRGCWQDGAGRLAVPDPVESLFPADPRGSPTGYDLPKKRLLRVLFGFIVENREQEIVAEPRREIVQAAINIASFSARNYPPMSPEIRKQNLASGWFG